MKQKSNVTSLPTTDLKKEDRATVSSLSPREIVSELDKYVIGQKAAKRAVAIALRNRWRRQALKGDMKDEVLPKNILMIGPTGVGKTEISRRLSKLAEAPFIKVEATRFTEVGYVGRDVEQIIRDLLEIAIAIEKERMRKEVYTKAQQAAEERVLNALVGNKASVATRESFRKRLRNGDLDNNEIEIEINDVSNTPTFEIPGMPGANVGMINLSEMLGKNSKKGKKKKMTVKESHEILIGEESDKMIEQDKIIKSAKISTENNGIVFLDEIDKVSARGERVGGDVSREGVQYMDSSQIHGPQGMHYWVMPLIGEHGYRGPRAMLLAVHEHPPDGRSSSKGLCRRMWPSQAPGSLYPPQLLMLQIQLMYGDFPRRIGERRHYFGDGRRP
mgnify:CR=1 FL=1